MRLEIDDDYIKWIGSEVRPALEKVGLHLTESAVTLLGAALQAQVAENLCPAP